MTARDCTTSPWAFSRRTSFHTTAAGVSTSHSLVGPRVLSGIATTRSRPNWWASSTTPTTRWEMLEPESEIADPMPTPCRTNHGDTTTSSADAGNRPCLRRYMPRVSGSRRSSSTTGVGSNRLPR